MHISADRKRINAWLGEDMDGYEKADGMSEEYVYITAGGEVYHTDSKCTHLLRYIKKCDKGYIEEIRNNSGSKYYECKVCKKNTGTITAFSTVCIPSSFPSIYKTTLTYMLIVKMVYMVLLF
jgi:hypothetical protein